MTPRVRIVGGGLAGCEAAWQLARRGVGVDLHEMRPELDVFLVSDQSVISSGSSMQRVEAGDPIRLYGQLGDDEADPWGTVRPDVIQSW